MNKLHNFFDILYQNFNDRKIDQVIEQMTEDVEWANGMDGGYVHGHHGVKEYWTRQFSMVSSQVTPLEIDTQKDPVKTKVHQVVHDLNGKLIADQIVYHLFYLSDNKISRFEIEG